MHMAGNNSIAFLCHPYHRGGVTRWMADAAIAFANNEWEVYFVTVDPTSPFFSGKGRETMLQLLQKGNAPVHIVSAKADSEFEFGTRQYREFVYKQLLLKVPNGIPVILSDDAAVWEAATFLHSTHPVVGVLHADEEHYYALAEKYFREVAIFACVSERVKKTTLQRIPGVNPEVLYTIPCGINLPAVDLDARNGDVLQLVYVGRVSEYQKRTSDLVKICSLLHRNGKVFHLDIIGDGEEKTSLENKFKEAGLASLVTFYGWLSQKAVGERLAASDILVLTSDFEGTPVAMMEALAAGCGIVGTRVSGIEDYELQPLAADCYAVFDVGNIDEAVSKINAIARIPASVRMHAARKMAENEFSMDVCLERYAKSLASIKPDEQMPVAKVDLPFQSLLYSRVIALARYLKVSVNRK